MRAHFALLILLISAAAPAGAHEIRPAFLRIREVQPSTYDMLWKTPAQGDMRLALDVVLPDNCRTAAAPRTISVEAAAIQRWRSVCEGGLLGKPIAIANLETTLTDVLVRFEPLEGKPKTLRMNGADPRIMLPTRESTGEIAEIYFRLGVEHILTGIDHLLFVLCLLMLIGDLKRLLGAVTAFTIAHSLTLAATSYGWIRLASAPVEACIALSIAFVAAEVLKARTGRATLIQQTPWLASLGFGLLHGLGFAAALRELGLPEDAVSIALLFFNVGVEAGQILFVATVLMAVFIWKRHAPRSSAWAYRASAYAAGIAGCFWFIERTARIFH
jgi:hypothetical protein